MGPELEWLQQRAGELGYQLDSERSLSTSQSPPESNANPIPIPPPSSYANPHVTISSNHNGSSDSEPPHGIHRVPTPMPGTRSNNPSPPQSTSSNSTPESNASSTLPNLPGLFHDWLTNPATHAQASAAIDACGNERVQRFAHKYIEVTEAIRERRKELGRLEMEEARCERSLGALDWDRRSIAGTLIGLRAESVIFPHVFPTVGLSASGTASRPSPSGTFPNQSANPITETPSSHHTHSSDSHPSGRSGVPIRIFQAPFSRELTPSPPDGSSGYAYPSGMGSSLQVPRNGHLPGRDSPDASDYHADRSQTTSIQAVRGSTTRRPESSIQRRGNHGIRCWECGDLGHTRRDCHNMRRRRAGLPNGREGDAILDGMIDDILQNAH
ncbi:uncharacterized protein STEHIDRAFT_164131 [Stereum hirsutum FP-91666 SS1]|uniref:CCHC-type domain-containing protein n=1 Tax=Stereum hirsutum (strain FP-91666) TaxID=721885 RepID=R7RW32_STEHR|nr:uncharacterized protein STEHIDRAFT_164131 [Stereum hirsutum FP-91666 SS1]EIM78980.1 hypothetical protein STEHIDRAFT_164131 [Stereum hirsutum FP-91666 SS1]